MKSGVSIKTKRYSRAKYAIAILSALVSITAIAIFILTGLSISLRDLVHSITGNFYLAVALYFSICYILYYILLLCINFYDTFVLEHRYGLSNQTLFGWEKMEVKKEALFFPFALIFCELMYILMRFNLKYWWLNIALLWIVFAVCIGRFAPVLIIPLFYKCKPLKNEGLKERLFKLLRRCGAGINKILLIDLSRDTKKANAGLAGIGKTRRILLSDTLISQFDDEEIEVVVAHELGHHKLLHIYKKLLLAACETIITLYLVNIIAGGLVRYFQLDNISDISSLPMIALTLIIINILARPVSGAFSRHMELSADMYALKHTGLFSAFRSLMEKLSRLNLRDPSPGRLAEIFFYDHPPVSRRIALSKKLEHIYKKESSR